MKQVNIIGTILKYTPLETKAVNNGNEKKAKFFAAKAGFNLKGLSLLECRLNFFSRKPNKIGLKKILRKAIRQGYYDLAKKISAELGVTLTMKQTEQLITNCHQGCEGWIFTEIEKMSPNFKSSILEEMLRISILYVWPTEEILQALGRDLSDKEVCDAGINSAIAEWCKS